jgi:hypothetical protein
VAAICGKPISPKKGLGEKSSSRSTTNHLGGENRPGIPTVTVGPAGSKNIVL